MMWSDGVCHSCSAAMCQLWVSLLCFWYVTSILLSYLLSGHMPLTTAYSIHATAHQWNADTVCDLEMAYHSKSLVWVSYATFTSGMSLLWVTWKCPCCSSARYFLCKNLWSILYWKITTHWHEYYATFLTAKPEELEVHFSSSIELSLRQSLANTVYE